MIALTVGNAAMLAVNGVLAYLLLTRMVVLIALFRDACS